MSEPRRHGDHFEEDDHEYMDDHINGVNWHVPDRTKLDDMEHPTDEDRDFYKWLNG